MTDDTVLERILQLPEADRAKLRLAVLRDSDVSRLLNHAEWEGACKACIDELIQGEVSNGAWRQTRAWKITKHAIVQAYKERYLLKPEW
jgi:hypothetical protein